MVITYAERHGERLCWMHHPMVPFAREVKEWPALQLQGRVRLFHSAADKELELTGVQAGVLVHQIPLVWRQPAK